MIIKTVKYQNFNGEEVEKTLHFHISYPEFTKLETSVEGGYGEKIKKLVKTKDNKEIVEVFDYLILNSYGVKSEDGEEFIKTPELKEKFRNSAAYAALFAELAQDENKAAEFINGILPTEVKKKMAEVEKSNN